MRMSEIGGGRAHLVGAEPREPCGLVMMMLLEVFTRWFFNLVLIDIHDIAFIVAIYPQLLREGVNIAYILAGHERTVGTKTVEYGGLDVRKMKR